MGILSSLGKLPWGDIARRGIVAGSTPNIAGGGGMDVLRSMQASGDDAAQRDMLVYGLRERAADRQMREREMKRQEDNDRYRRERDKQEDEYRRLNTKVQLSQIAEPLTPQQEQMMQTGQGQMNQSVPMSGVVQSPEIQMPDIEYRDGWQRPPQPPESLSAGAVGASGPERRITTPFANPIRQQDVIKFDGVPFYMKSAAARKMEESADKMADYRAQQRIMTEELDARDARKRDNEMAMYRPIPDFVADALHMQRGTRVPPNELDSYVKAVSDAANRAEDRKSREALFHEADATKKLVASIAASARGGQNDYRNTMGMARDYRNEPMVKEYQTVRAAYDDIASSAQQADSDPSGASDVILMRKVAKITDPTTGVREEEYRTFSGAGGLINMARLAASGKWIEGKRLSPELRKSFVDLVGHIVKSREKILGQVKAKYARQAQRFGVDPSLIFYDQDEPLNVGQPQQPAVPTVGGTFNGQKVLKVERVK